jgi:hypothetical protein
MKKENEKATERFNAKLTPTEQAKFIELAKLFGTDKTEYFKYMCGLTSFDTITTRR